MDEELLQPFLDKATEDAKAEIREKGILSEHNAIALLMKLMFNHVSELYAKSDNLEKEIVDIRANMATKDDIANMATKDDIANMATKDDIESLKTATKDDIGRIEKNMERLERGFSRFEFLLLFSFGLLSVIVILTQIFIK